MSTQEKKLYSRNFLIYCNIIGLLSIGLVAGLSATKSWYDLSGMFLFLVAGILAHRYSFTLSERVYVSLDSTIGFALVLIYGPIKGAALTALLNFIGAILKNIHKNNIHTYSLAFLNTGIQTIMVLLAGCSYQFIGGAIPLTKITWGFIPPTLAWYFIASGTNIGFMIPSLLMRGQRVGPFLKRIKDIFWIDFIILPIGILMALLY